MVFADPLFVPEEIDQYRAEVLTAWATADPEMLPRAAEAYRQRIARYPGSSELPRYRYQLALYLHEDGRDAEAAAQLRLIDRSGLDSLLSDRVRNLEQAIERAPAREEP